MKRVLFAGLLTSCALVTSLDDLAGAGDAAGGDAQKDSATCAADTMGDPNNCGACGHGCQGGDCQQGMCQPFAIITGQANLAGLTVDQTFAFWSYTASPAYGLRRATKADGGGLADIGNLTSDKMIVSGNDLIGVTNGASGGVFVLPNAGAQDAGSVVMITTTTFPYVEGLAVDGARAYFIATNFTDGGTALEGVALDGGAPSSLAKAAIADAVVVGNGMLYFWDGTTISTRSASLAPDAVSSLVPNVTDVSAMAFANTSAGPRIVWASQSAGTVELAPADTPTNLPVVVAASQGGPNSVAVDATRMYWANKDGTIVACDFTPNSKPQILATAQASPLGIVVDATSIYWINENSASVMKLAKP